MFPRTSLLPVVCAGVLAIAASDTPRDRPVDPVEPSSGRQDESKPREAAGPAPSTELGLGLGLGTEEEVLEALERGLAWLAVQQAAQRDGSFPRAGGQKHVPVPTTAIAALAFMAAGSMPERGPHGREVALAVDYLTLRADMTPGSDERGYISSEGDELSRMHGHGFATLALTQAYSISPRTTRGRRLGEVLREAVALIERSQGLEGGWFYQPRASTEHENSVTVCLVQALRAARDTGFEVDVGVIGRAVDYVRRCQAEDGSFRYGLETDKTTLALTAAGLSTLNFLGQYEGPEVDRGMENLWQRLELRRDRRRGSNASFPYYERLYLALALWQHPDRRLFDSWSAAERKSVLKDQLPDGSWEDDQFGSCYATAMNCLFLGVPQGLLPVFQR